MKYADLELEEPITRDRYQVQVKSRARQSELQDYAERFSGSGYRRLYFVVHSPEDTLRSPKPKLVEVVLPGDLAAKVLDAGLIAWVTDKVR